MKIKSRYAKQMIGITVVLIMILLTGCSGAETQQPPTESEPTPINGAPGILSDRNANTPGTQNGNNATIPQPQNGSHNGTPIPSPMIRESGFDSGMYKIGQDMPAGEYKLFNTGGLTGASYFEIAKDSSNALESIIANDNFFSFTYVTVSDGQYFKFTDAHAFPSDEAKVTGSENGKYVSGMYKVGVDIPAGEYKVYPEENSTLGYGYFEITTSSRHTLDDIVANDNFQDLRYITLKNGQYVKLNEAYIEAGTQ